MLWMMVWRSWPACLLEGADAVRAIECTVLFVGLDEGVGERCLMQLILLFGTSSDHYCGVLSRNGLRLADGSVRGGSLCFDYRAVLTGTLVGSYSLWREIDEVVVCTVEVDLGSLLGLELFRIQSNDSVQVSIHCLLLIAMSWHNSSLWAHGGLDGCTTSTYSRS